MDIGPIRRRFTAEPLSSPVPGEESPVHEAPAHERQASRPVADEQPPASATVPATHA